MIRNEDHPQDFGIGAVAVMFMIICIVIPVGLACGLNTVFETVS